MSEDYKYDLRGVSATKSEVHAAIKGLDKGLYPNAFCKILPDVTGGNDPDYCNLMHADTAGTKTSIAYMYWKETGDASVWSGIAQDSIVMNLDDMACVGCVDDIVLSSTIGRNKLAISGEVISKIINGANDFVNGLKEHDVHIHMSGGETADVGDIVRTIDVGYTAFARMRRDQVIVNDIQPGDVIVGLASYGQATYENNYNAGTGSNGLTSARHDLLHSSMGEKYPESFDPNMPKEVAYVGKHKLTDEVSFDDVKTNIGKLILSPTRTYLPVLKKIFKTHRSKINGLIHCTGGGQIKVEKFMQNRRVIKNNLLETPHLFKLIQEAANADWKEMYQVYNMGHRLEFYLPKSEADAIIEIAKSFNIDAQIVGHVEEAEQNEVVIDGAHGTFTYVAG
ncbi:MAG: AIR synthase related protein [Saprospiraceae bacterium]